MKSKQEQVSLKEVLYFLKENYKGKLKNKSHKLL